MSLALWRRASPPSLILYVINHHVADGTIAPRGPIAVRLPVDREPTHVRVASLDWAGEKPGTARAGSSGLTVELPSLEAYYVAILDYDTLPVVKLDGCRIVPSMQ